jgi:hypothetical protein
VDENGVSFTEPYKEARQGDQPMSVSTASRLFNLLSPCLRWAWDGAKPRFSMSLPTPPSDKGTLFHRMMDDYYTGYGGTLR